jgi:acyl dehydratase
MERTRRLEQRSYSFDDLMPGDWFATPELTIRESHIDRFAELSGDFFEIHMSDAHAQKLGFPRRVAHGILVLALTDGLKNQSVARLDAVASLGWNWSFNKPVFVGDTIHAVVTVIDKRQTGRPDRGIARLRFDVSNQKGETVQSGTNELMMLRAGQPLEYT